MRGVSVWGWACLMIWSWICLTIAVRGPPGVAGARSARVNDCGPEPSLRTAPASSSLPPEAAAFGFPWAHRLPAHPVPPPHRASKEPRPAKRETPPPISPPAISIFRHQIQTGVQSRKSLTRHAVRLQGGVQFPTGGMPCNVASPRAPGVLHGHRGQQIW